MSTILENYTRPAKKQESVIHTQSKKRNQQIDFEWSQMLDLADRHFKVAI